MFLFCLDLGLRQLFLVPLWHFLFAPLAVHGAGSGHQSISASLLNSGDWRHSFQPSSSWPVTTSTPRQESWAQTWGSCVIMKILLMKVSYLCWGFKSYEIFEIAQTDYTRESLHNSKFSSSTSCQVWLSGAGLTSHPPWPQFPNKGALILLSFFFHCPRIFVQFQFLLTAKLTTNRLL